MKDKHKYRRITRQLLVSYVFMGLVFVLSPLLIFVLTRNLSVAEYGIYSIFSVTRMVLVVILELGMSQYILTKFAALNHNKKIKSFYSILLFEVVFNALVIGIMLIPYPNSYILSILKIGAYTSEFKILLAIIFTGVMIRIFSFYVISQRRLELQSTINFLQECLWIILLIPFAAFILKPNLMNVVLIWLAGVMLTLLFCILCLKKDMGAMIANKRKSVDTKILKEGLCYGIPLVPAVMGSWILMVGDRYLLNYYADAATVGIYSLAYSLSILILSFSTIIINVFYPYIAEAWSKKKDHNMLFNMSMKYGLMIIIPSTLAMFVLRDAIITMVSGVSYLAAAPILAILVFHPFFAFVTLVMRQHLLLRARTKIIGVVYVLGAAFNITINIILIPKIGVYGAAATALVTNILMFIASVIICRKYIKLNHSFIKTTQIVAASLLMAVVLYFINPATISMKIIAIVVGFLVYILCLFLFGAFVKEEIALIKNLRIRKFFK